MELLWEIAGWAGAAAILSAYLAVSMNWIQAGRAFQTANLLGACAFIVNGALHEAWPSVATNVAWFFISGVALLRLRSPRSLAAAPLVEELPVQAPRRPGSTGGLGVVVDVSAGLEQGGATDRVAITTR
ncbi:CBU_0592 family membrane protein [Arthrobacter sp. MAHUQ-56]